MSDFGTAVVVVTLGPVLLVTVVCVVFMLWEDWQSQKFYRDLQARSKRGRHS